MHRFYSIWIFLASVTLLVVVMSAVLAYLHRRRGRSTKNSGDLLPDFAIVDCGEAIHLVPVERDRHRIDNTGRCQCTPVISINQRRRGSYVRYVDHHPAGSRPTVPPSVHGWLWSSTRHEHWWHRAA